MEEKEKKLFWKDKKNVAIVILLILLFFSIISTSSDTTPSDMVAELKSELNVVNDEKANDTLSSTASGSSMKTTKSTETVIDSQPANAETGNSYIVNITNTGNKYHRHGCSYLKSKNAVDKNDATAQGYTHCHRCNP